MYLNEYNIECKPYTIQSRDFNIPIYIHIRDVHISNTTTVRLGDKGNIYFDEFGVEYERLRERNNLKQYLKFINTDAKIFDNDSKNFLEFHNLKKIEELLDYLDIQDMGKIIMDIQEGINKVIDRFMKVLIFNMELDLDIPSSGKYEDDDKMPEDLSTFLQYTSEYIEGQILMEYNSNPFFKENKDKTPSEWSYREWEYRKAYVTLKSKKDSASEGYKANKMEKMRKENERKR